MIDISVSKLNKFYGDHHVLRDLSFNIESGERVGLLGDNGSGKTTLFKILSGELDYDSGDILIPKDKTIAVVSQIPVYPAGFTVNEVLNSAFSRLEEISAELRRLEKLMEIYSDRDVLSKYDKLSARFQHMGGYDTETQVNKICNGLGIPREMRERIFESLSGGEKTRIVIACALLQDPDILLLDEPTKGLDAEFKVSFARIINKLTSQGVTVLKASNKSSLTVFFTKRACGFCVSIATLPPRVTLPL